MATRGLGITEKDRSHQDRRSERVRGVFFSFAREPVMACSWRTRAMHTGEMQGVTVPMEARFAVVTEIDEEAGR